MKELDNLEAALDERRPEPVKPAEAPKAPKSKAKREPLVASFYRGLGGGTHTKDLTRPRPADQLEEWLEQLRRIGAGV